MIFRTFNMAEKPLPSSGPAIDEKTEPNSETHWIKYCTDCPEDVACKDYEV